MKITRGMDLTGQRYGRLVVVQLATTRSGKSPGLSWVCVCDCGTTKTIRAGSLRDGHISSCGCYLKECRLKNKLTHGEARGTGRSAEYTTWTNIKNRCYEPSAKSFKAYGGRGIKVCDRWLNSFENFLADMGRRPPGITRSGRALYSIDRVDVNGDYEPSNCRWATCTEQNNNMHRTIMISVGDRRMALGQWSRESGILTSTLRRRHLSGWCEDHILSRAGVHNADGCSDCRDGLRRALEKREREAGSK